MVRNSRNYTVILDALSALHKMRNFNNKWISHDLLILLLHRMNLLPEIMSGKVFNEGIKRRIPDIDTKHSLQFITRRDTFDNKKRSKIYGYYLKNDCNASVYDVNWTACCFFDYDKLINSCIPCITRSTMTAVASSSTSSSLVPPSLIHQLNQAHLWVILKILP